MAEEWAGIVNDTAPKYLKGASDATRRERLLLAMMTKRGRISYNHNSFELRFQVEFSQPAMQAYGDGGVIEFNRHDAFRQLVLDWRGYKTSDSMSTKEKLMNAGDSALIRRYDTIMPRLTKSMKDKFCAELYVDGYATGNENRIVGIESFMGTGGSTTGADRLATPSDTYAGKSTALANQGGSWSSGLTTYPNATLGKDWPDGSGTSEYDYLSPKLVNWSSSGWGTSSQTWEDNCERAIRQANIWTTLTSGKSGKIDMILMAGNLFYDYQNKQSAKQRIIIPFKEAEDLGFVGGMNQEGLGLYYEFDCPANTAYGFNIDEMELRSLQSDLFVSRGPEYDIKTDSWLFVVGFFGNAWFNPKAFCKIKNFAT